MPPNFAAPTNQLSHRLNYPPVARKLIEDGGNRAGSHSEFVLLHLQRS